MTAFDLPGHGRSARWDGRAEIQAVTSDIAATFCEGGCDVIGHSFGATVALRLAIEYPELVRSLILIEPVFFAVAIRDAPDIWAKHEQRVSAFNKACQIGDTRAAAREFTAIWGDGSPWETLPSAVQRGLADLMYLITAAASALHEDPAGMLEAGRLDVLTVPVLLMEGSASPAVISAIHTGLMNRLPDARRVVIAGAGHMLPMTHADQVAREILRFL